MGRFIFTILMASLAIAVQAQSHDKAQRREWGDAFMQADSLASDTIAPASGEVALPWFEPSLTAGGYGLAGCGLCGGLYAPAWRLHEGFNAELGLSLSAGLGKHAPRGVGFGQTAAFAYLLPVTKRLSVAAGIFASNMDWGAWRRTDAGVAGVMAYQLSDRVSLYAFGSKTFLPREEGFNKRRDPFPLFFDLPRDRFGAAAEFKIGNNAMIGVSVERTGY